VSLKAFHLLFIAISVILAAFFGAWSFNEYQAGQHIAYAASGVVALATGVGLAMYGAAFQRKAKNL
jgi:hypothetical protein